MRDQKEFITVFKEDCHRCDGSCRDESGLPCGYCQGAGEIVDVEKTIDSLPEYLKQAIKDHFEDVIGHYASL